jgi:2-haloacid dehalogenase
MKINAIIYDLGGVLIDWNPAYVFDEMFGEDTEKKKYFFENICTADWNEEQDAGRSLNEATEMLVTRHPDWKEYIEAYYGRWQQMLGGPIQDSVEVLRELKKTGRYKLYALTNWSSETFPIALELYEFLHWFDGRVVSGDEKMRKPFPQFYQLILNRYHLVPEETLFIDDNVRNVKAAEELGINAIAFTSANQLKEYLKKAGLL